MRRDPQLSGHNRAPGNVPRYLARPIHDATIANDATPIIQARMEAIHVVILRDFTSHEAAECDMIKFLRNTINKLWYRDLKNPAPSTTA